MSLRVCYFGTYRSNYERNQIILECLRRNNIEVSICHANLWHGVEDREQAASGGWLKPAFWWRAIKAYTSLLRQYAKVKNYDILFVGYPGQIDVFLARWLSRLHRKRLVWDVYNSIYLIAKERGLDRRSPLTIRLLRIIEREACRLPDLLLQDTQEYVQWLCTTHGLRPERFQEMPIGADDRVFLPTEFSPGDPHHFQVLYYGTFIPNHGIQYILEAAHLLENEADIYFEMIGTGPELENAQALAGRYSLKQVNFTGWMEKQDLVNRAKKADVFLGAFGGRPQSLMTIHNKIFEAMAMAKPVITGESPATRRAFKHGENIYLCHQQDPQSLAQAIRTLRDDVTLRQCLSYNGLALFQAKYDLNHQAQRLMEILNTIL